MVNNRYIYYLIVVNAFVNSINFVPRMLIDSDGSLIAIFVSAIIGALLIFLFTKAISKFPGKDFSEILEPVLPKFIRGGMIIFFSLHWYVFGAITLASLVDITHRYITPDVNPYVLTAGFLLLVLFACQVESYSILSVIETVIVINIPLVIYFLFKVLFNDYFSWDTVREVITDSLDIPPYQSVAAGTFIFSGYINLVVFNRLFESVKIKRLWLVVTGLLFLMLLSFLVPIAYNGIDGVKHHIYPWMTTVDSIQIKYFIVERMMFIFYLFYITVSLAAIILFWHVGLRMMQGVLFKKESREFKWKNLVLLGGFTIGTFFLIHMDQFSFLSIGNWFIRVRFFSEVLLLMLLFFAVWRVKKA
ncbi:GerAB/ArcD/ProY family transporter [Peribacillus sp. SCS-37]|uniref:GerAB/ArcD/ProY family transporter n=1 Tax=Paraperibacillus esterisolvens TaxID=3115296 RepID=UPI0039057FE0